MIVERQWDRLQVSRSRETGLGVYRTPAMCPPIALVLANRNPVGRQAVHDLAAEADRARLPLEQHRFQPLFPVAPVGHALGEQKVEIAIVVRVFEMAELVRDDVVDTRKWHVC